MFGWFKKSPARQEPVRCEICGAGHVVRLDWGGGAFDAEEDRARTAALDHREDLGRGSLFACRICQEPWWVDAQRTAAHHVTAGKLALLRAWSEADLSLSPAALTLLKKIGPTPPHQYAVDNGDQQFPCAIITRSGERFDHAVLSLQADPPLDSHRPVRLAGEIAEVLESPDALPLAVRKASARSHELAMGYAPTLIDMPDGESFLLNGTQNFLVKRGRRAGEAKVSKSLVSRESRGEVVNAPDDEVLFVAAPPISARGS